MNLEEATLLPPEPMPSSPVVVGPHNPPTAFHAHHPGMSAPPPPPDEATIRYMAAAAQEIVDEVNAHQQLAAAAAAAAAASTKKRPRSTARAARAAPPPPPVRPPKRRRYCSVPGCGNIVKSQGLCQRHGAKARRCVVPDCTKQAQGNFDGMCKYHFHSLKRATRGPDCLEAAAATSADQPPPAWSPDEYHESAYDRIIPQSIGWKSGVAGGGSTRGGRGRLRATRTSPAATETPAVAAVTNDLEESSEMPLIRHLRAGFEARKQPGWHRNEERAARGWPLVSNRATQLEGWERELVWAEILLLTGTPGASFRHLARAWGRDKGFHTVLAQFICQRRGNVERKRPRSRAATATAAAPAAATAAAVAAVELAAQGPLPVHHDEPHDSESVQHIEPVQPEVPPARNHVDHEQVAADVWDDSNYGTAVGNEALAADLFYDAHDGYRGSPAASPSRAEREQLAADADAAAAQANHFDHHPDEDEDAEEDEEDEDYDDDGCSSTSDSETEPTPRYTIPAQQQGLLHGSFPSAQQQHQEQHDQDQPGQFQGFSSRQWSAPPSSESGADENASDIAGACHHHQDQV
jgi:hypothetical protein